MINIESANTKGWKHYHLCISYNWETKKDELLWLPPVSPSSEESMTDSDYMTPGDSSYSSMASSISSDTSDDDTVSLECNL